MAIIYFLLRQPTRSSAKNAGCQQPYVMSVTSQSLSNVSRHYAIIANIISSQRNKHGRLKDETSKQNGVVNHGYKDEEERSRAGSTLSNNTSSINNNNRMKQAREVTLTIDTGPPGDLGEHGFELTGGRNNPYFNNDPGIYIIDVPPGSLVENALDSGDQLIEIDGFSLANVPLYVAYNLIRASNRRAVISVLKHPDNEMKTIPEDSDDSGPEMGEADDVSTVGSSLDTRTSARGEVVGEMADDTDGGREVEVDFMTGRKGHLDELDFEFAGGRDHPYVSRNGGIFITKVERGSLLENDLSPGDRIIMVEGVDTTNVPQHVVKNLIRASDGIMTMVVRKINRSKMSKALTQMHDTTDGLAINVNRLPGLGELLVEIDSGKKGSKGNLGFKITGGRNKPCVPGDPGIFVKAVKPGSSVSNILKPGDKILSIDGQSVTNVLQAQAHDLIRAADRKVCLHIKEANAQKVGQSVVLLVRSVSQSYFLSGQSASRITFQVGQSAVSLFRSETVDKEKKKFSDQFPDEKIQEFKIAFEMYCRKDYKIPTKALPRVCKSLGYNYTLQDLDYLISGEFHDGRGITFPEFLKMMSEMTFYHKTDTDILDAFHVFDRDKMGYFDLDKLKAAFESMPDSDTIDEEEMASLIAIADSNQDGKVYFQAPLWNSRFSAYFGECPNIDTIIEESTTDFRIILKTKFLVRNERFCASLQYEIYHRNVVVLLVCDDRLILISNAFDFSIGIILYIKG
ncbi:predicted protein [Nematostella vectensis]|uniref:Uncharacterized protein n=1 Tax=Nematostella vectensis TaxID=45351 RepID=A7RPN5_NEMVE|nr:predicted protein [Nematostella vectensis]|eukprot:XP_001638667.1 predicted protein [Nematostella vectensis]